MVKAFRNKNSTDTLPNDFSMTKELALWLKDKYNQRTVASPTVSVNEMDNKSKIKEALKDKLKKEMSMTGTGALVIGTVS
jgi:hypothetical protein